MDDDLTDEERQAVIAAVRKALADDPFPRSPRLEPPRSALAKLDPASVPRPLPERVRCLRRRRGTAADEGQGDNDDQGVQGCGSYRRHHFFLQS
jgi:hypothetical protein